MMILTEEEAQTKWCPFARYVLDDSERMGGHPGYPTGNRWGGYEAAEVRCKCLASECMAWTWTEYEWGGGPVPERGKPIRGCCGLAEKNLP